MTPVEGLLLFIGLMVLFLVGGLWADRNDARREAWERNHMARRVR